MEASWGSTGSGFPSGTGSVRYLSLPVLGSRTMPWASEYAASPFSTPGEEPPAMAWAAAIFSSAVNPPSSPPGRDSIPEVGAGVAAGSVSSCAAGFSVGAGSAEAAGTRLADGKGVVWGVEPAVSRETGGGVVFSTVHPCNPGAPPPYQNAAARMTSTASTPTTFPLVSFTSSHRPPTVYRGSTPDTAPPCRSTRSPPSLWARGR